MNTRIAFIGGDKRMFYCAEALYERGFECTLYGFDRISDRAGSTRCPSLRDCLLNASAAVLPVPLSRDGVNVCCDGLSIKLAEVFAAVSPEIPVLAGAVSEKAQCIARSFGHIINDYLEDEVLAEKNAFVSAEGAVSLAMRSSDGAVFGSECLVAGYGRIGRYTARLLGALGARVTVFARRDISRLKAELDGFCAVSPEELTDAAGSFDIIFNTVPAQVFGAEQTAKMHSSQVYIELASPPFGIDKNLAEKSNLEITDGSSLPSKYCPKTAGGFIAEHLCGEFERMGIV